jgi:hypothetical protein
MTRTGSSTPSAPEPLTGFGLAEVRVRGFRAARDVVLAPGGLCALVGEANAGKSTLLEAVHALLDPAARPLRRSDGSEGGDGTIVIEGALASGAQIRVERRGRSRPGIASGGAPGVVYMPSELRSSVVIARGRAGAAVAADPVARFVETFDRARAPHPPRPSTTAAAVSLVAAVESLCQAGLTGAVVLVEEPELYLRPQAQRYLYRLLRRLVSHGNQVVYATHAPTFLNVARLDELAFVEHRRGAGIRVRRPQPFTAEHDFRFLTEFDAERSELLLARAAVLVEGATEKLVLPFVFRALGHDADREAISIVECGGKSNIPLFARVCHATGIPFVAVHDRDAPPRRRPIASERAVNRQIAETVAARRIVELAPDFEHVAGLAGHRHKPERAWERFSGPGATIPEPLARAVRLAVALARD